MNGTIHLPSIVPPSDRQRRAEIRSMIGKIVRQPVVDLKTFGGLKRIDNLLSEKIKLEDNNPQKPDPNSPKGGPKTGAKSRPGKIIA